MADSFSLLCRDKAASRTPFLFAAEKTSCQPTARQTAIKELSEVFAETRGCVLPDWKNDPKGSQKTWGTPLGKMWDDCKKNTELTKIIVKQAIT